MQQVRTLIGASEHRLQSQPRPAEPMSAASGPGLEPSAASVVGPTAARGLSLAHGLLPHDKPHFMPQCVLDPISPITFPNGSFT